MVSGLPEEAEEEAPYREYLELTPPQLGEEEGEGDTLLAILQVLPMAVCVEEVR